MWGTSTMDHEMVCDGKRVHTTRNLHNALCAVGHPTQPRDLWADSVCINQEDMAEKSLQVILMGDIYRRSSRALIYLGQDTNGNAKCAAAIVGEMHEMIWSLCSPRATTIPGTASPSPPNMTLWHGMEDGGASALCVTSRGFTGDGLSRVWACSRRMHYLGPV